VGVTVYGQSLQVLSADTSGSVVPLVAFMRWFEHRHCGCMLSTGCAGHALQSDRVIDAGDMLNHETFDLGYYKPVSRSRCTMTGQFVSSRCGGSRSHLDFGCTVVATWHRPPACRDSCTAITLRGTLCKTELPGEIKTWHYIVTSCLRRPHTCCA